MNWNARQIGVRAAEALATAVLYFAAGRIGLLVPFTSGNVSPMWPSAGIALGLALVLGRHVLVGVAIGAFLVNAFSPIPHLTALVIAVGNTVGPAVSATLLKKRSVVPIRRLFDVLALIVLGGLGAAIGAVIGPSALALSGIVSNNRLPVAMAVWWIGDLLGILLVVPLIVNFADLKARTHRLPELLILVACLLASSELLFRQNTLIGSVFGFALLPFILWGAVRFSIVGAALPSCLVSLFAVWETAHGRGPFAVYGSWGHHVEALQVFTAVLSISGLCLAAVIAERDTVEQALAHEEKLRRAQEQYRRIVETTNDGVWMIDADFRTIFVNRRMAEMLGCTPEEMLGRSPADLVFPEDVTQKLADFERRRSGLHDVFYTRYRRKDGSELWTLVSAAPIFSEGGKFAGSLAMHSDVTILRKTEETLRRNEKLITAGRLAASISHEVNNPLEAVVNLLYLLKAQPLDEPSHQYVELAQKQILRVSAISKRSLGFFRDTSAPTELHMPHLLDDTLSFYEHELASRAVNVVRDYRTQGLVRVSQGEMQQVFTNLISNALDAMEQGGVLTVRVLEAENHGGVSIEVADTGAGISDSNLKRVFEPFFTTKQNTGTGLGLWVAKQIVEKHGGRIAVQSPIEPGRSGTQFSIFLPRAAEAHAVA